MLTRHAQEIYGDQWEEAQDDIVPVDVTPVAKWWSEGTPQMEWDWREDFGSILPPWDYAWFEYSRPRRYNDNGTVREYSDWRPSQRTGATVVSHDVDRLKDEWSTSEWKWVMDIEEDVARALLHDDVKYFVTYNVYESDRNGCFWLGERYDFLDEHGNAVSDESRRSVSVVPDQRGKHRRVKAVGQNTIPILFAISLCHCNNITIWDDQVPEPVQKKRRKSGKNPGKTFKCLDIEPMKKQSRRESEEGESDVERALHICRGHFKTYTEENPLFGKHTGTYWWPMHARGTQEAGEVEKSYRVDSPE